ATSASRLTFLPHVSKHYHAQGGGQWDRQDAAQQSPQQRRTDHHRDDDGERMQPDPVPHDFRRNDETFQGLHHSEHGQHEQRMEPVAELNERDDQRQDAGGDGAEKRNHRQHGGERPKQEGIRQADDEEADRVEGAIAHRDDDLSTKEGDEVIVDGLDYENEFVF